MHKTGTKFFQHKAFPNLNSLEILYNPPRLCQLICDLLKCNACDLDLVMNDIATEKRKLEAGSAKKILISREIMSGNLFGFYNDYVEIYSRLNLAFPEAKIIIALRYQVDWIVSCYRESIHEHHYQTIGQFLGFEEGDPRFLKVDYKDLNYLKIINFLESLFTPENINVFFYEDFYDNKEKILSRIASILGVKNIPIIKDNDTIPNRGYSALAIDISIKRYKFLKICKLDRFFVHRPITFFGPDSIPAGFEQISVLPKDRYWHDRFLRDNEEVRLKGYPNNLDLTDRVKLALSWRNIIKNIFDKIIYKDWDLLEPYRLELDNYFKNQNIELQKKASKVVGVLPVIYL